ncbi:MAG: T9SS type A sorting domain-containing protein [Ignavibacteria bacterium]|nr:T9SS type A sorting domain-containing protein [Ignavibacteria bacterium]
MLKHLLSYIFIFLSLTSTTFLPAFATDSLVITPLKMSAFGGDGRDIDYVTQNIGYICGDDALVTNNYIGKTTDGGATWQNITPTALTVRPRALDFINENVGFIGCYYGKIIKTTDGGVTWDTIYTSGYSGTIYDIVFINNDIGFACGSNSNGTVLKTADGGNTWTIVYNTTTNTRYGIDFFSMDDIIVCGSSGSVIKTTDGGVSWTSRTASTSTLYDIDVTSSDVVWVINSTEAIYKSVDRGETFSLVLDNGSSAFYAMHFFDETYGAIVGTNGTMYYTKNGGVNFDTVTIENFTGQVMRSVYMKSATDIQALGDQGIIIRSTDGCETWKYVENGYILYGVDFLDENFGIAVGNRGYIIKTTDGGTTWKDIMTIQSTINLYDVKVFDTQTYYICGGTGLLYITEDGGETFTKRPLPVVSGNSKTLHFFNRNEGYCAGEMGYIYYTMDAGETWTSQFYFGASSNNIEDVFFLNDTTGFAIGERGKFVKTSNRMTWDSSGIDGPNINTLWEMDFLDESIGYITSTRGCIYKTTDGGASWALQNDTSRLAAVDVFDLDVLDELHGYAVGENGRIFKITSINTWAEAASIRTPYNSEENFWGLDFVHSNLAFISGYYGSMYKMTTGVVGVQENVNKPKVISLLEAYPNPFNPSTEIRVGIEKEGTVSLTVYNILGQQVASVVENKILQSGNYSFPFTARTLNSGMYIARLEVHATNGTFIHKTMKMMLVK